MKTETGTIPTGIPTPQVLAEKLGIPFITVEPLRTGIYSKKLVAAYRTRNGTRFVGSFGPEVASEIEQHDDALNSPAGSMIVPLVYANEKEGAMVAIYAEDIVGGPSDLRKEISTGQISSDAAMRIQHRYIWQNVLWWQHPPKNVDKKPIYSMQRTEWSDVRKKTFDMIGKLAKKFNISPWQLYSLPITHNGQEYPSIAQLMRSLQKLYSGYPRKLVYGNLDMSSKNVWANPETEEIQNFDMGMTGQCDPGEALSVAIKAIYLGSVNIDTTSISMEVRNRKVVIDMKAEILDVAEKFQNHGREMLPSIAKKLDDETLVERTYLYLAGNQLNGFANAEERAGGAIEKALFVILQSLEACKEYNHKKEERQQKLPLVA